MSTIISTPSKDLPSIATPTQETSPKQVRMISPGGEDKTNQITRLLNLTEGIELFRDTQGEGFAKFAVDSHFEVAPIKSPHFKHFLSKMYFDKYKTAILSPAINDALENIEAKAMFGNDVRDTFVRIAGHGGKIYLDLADEQWRAIEIDCKGWRLVASPPVMFRRPKGMLPLPEPATGGSITELRELINVDEQGWMLIVGWLLATFRDKGPYPVLVIYGPQGSAKSTTSKLLRSIVDPNVAPARSLPSKEKDLAIAAKNGWVQSFDNLTGLHGDKSDWICRLATGAGLATRKLYRDDEESIFEASRPIILNGITEPASKSDLLDRSLLIALPTIRDNMRRTEQELLEAFERSRPGILGALLTAVSAAIKNVGTVKLTHLPRMADFYQWVVAALSSVGIDVSAFQRSYDQNLADHNILAIESSRVGKAVLNFARRQFSWSGTASQLLIELKQELGGNSYRPNTLSQELRRVQPNLEKLGVRIEFGRGGPNGDRIITITRLENDISESASGASGASTRTPPFAKWAAGVMKNADRRDGRRRQFSQNVRSQQRK